MYDSKFEVIIADDEETRSIHYALRYKVFCLESGFENPKDFPEGKERDEWDSNAIHFLVRERNTGQWVATMRLVSPHKSMLPIDSHTDIKLPHRPSISHCAEISRLCIVGHCRQREHGHVVSTNTTQDMENLKFLKTPRIEPLKRRQTVEILKALMNAGAMYSSELGIRYWYMLVTQSLARILGRTLPLDLQQAGDSCWHRGERFPFLADLNRAISSLSSYENFTPLRPAPLALTASAC